MRRKNEKHGFTGAEALQRDDGALKTRPGMGLTSVNCLKDGGISGMDYWECWSRFACASLRVMIFISGVVLWGEHARIPLLILRAFCFGSVGDSRNLSKASCSDDIGL